MSFVAAGDEFDDDLELYDYGGALELEEPRKTFPEPTLNSLVSMELPNPVVNDQHGAWERTGGSERGRSSRGKGHWEFQQ